MIRKISGKNKSLSYTHLNMVGTDSKATSKTDIADTLGETFCHNSSSFTYSEFFRKIKTEQEKVKLNFKSQNNHINVKPDHHVAFATDRNVHTFSDSLSVLKAMNHTGSKNPQIQKLLKRCHELLAYKEIVLSYRYPRE